MKSMSKEELLGVFERIYQLIAYDDDTPIEDLRANIDHVREQCEFALKDRWEKELKGRQS